MAKYTSNFNLLKPELTDAPPDITTLNANWDALDTELKNVQDDIDDLKNGMDDAEYLPLTGGTVTGTVVLSKVMDAEGDSYSQPALVVGGDPTTYHLELDNNEIQAKINETTPGNLFLNSNGGKVSVGEGGLTVNGNLDPAEPLISNMGTSTLPWNRVYARYVDLCGAADALYGRFRVGTTGTANTEGSVVLELGNATPSGTANNASSKITMYGTGTAFTNILPSTRTEGSNAVTLPTESGVLAVLGSNGLLPVNKGGTGVASLDELATALGACRIATGNYTGTGAAKTLTFSFAPKAFIVLKKSDDATTSCFGFSVQGSGSMFTVNGTSDSHYVRPVTYNANKLTIPKGSTGEVNQSDKMYYYVVFG